MVVRPAGPLLALALLLAGCSDPDPAQATPEPAPGIITDPTQGLDDLGAHIHDYWGGGDRVVVVDATHPGGDARGTGPGVSSGRDVEVRSFVPDSGNVVPQGTAAVEVTFSWTDATLDSYAAPALFVKTAGTNATERIQDLENGQTVTVETGAPDADLPHQLLSAWLFELRMSSPDPAPLRFKGAVSLKVEAVRGDEPLPVFPAHPDRWNGSSEIRLVDAAAPLTYWEDTGDAGCNSPNGDCPQVFRPASGAIVPMDARHVRVEVTYTSQVALELHVHGATARDLARAEPTEAESGRVAYELTPAEFGGDGPYATQSQWEFTVLPVMTGPVRTAWMAEYTITATAVK